MNGMERTCLDWWVGGRNQLEVMMREDGVFEVRVSGLWLW